MVAATTNEGRHRSLKFTEQNESVGYDLEAGTGAGAGAATAGAEAFLLKRCDRALLCAGWVAFKTVGTETAGLAVTTEGVAAAVLISGFMRD